jgi:hypothetical protein
MIDLAKMAVSVFFVQCLYDSYDLSKDVSLFLSNHEDDLIASMVLSAANHAIYSSLMKSAIHCQEKLANHKALPGISTNATDCSMEVLQ